ncbi:hypothetical protein ACTMTF_11355 [Nonomuraea sp. ZG12]|uniref:hypothetical protein n=1 Tax=Nonomuraea sp. ZG12 TaxID=3452207 RepID=UPI003F8CB2E4
MIDASALGRAVKMAGGVSSSLPRPSLHMNSNAAERIAMVQRRTVRLIVLIATGVILSIEVFHFFADEPKRFSEVYAGAVQMAHPEYRMRPTDVSIGLISTRLEFRGDGYGRSKIGSLDASVSMNALRYLSKSLPPSTKMTGILHAFSGGQGTNDSAKMQARHKLAELPENTFSTAVIELTEPLDEQKLNLALAGLVDTKTDISFLFLSTTGMGMKKPIFWRPCAVYRVALCEQASSLELYRRWVSRLSWVDGIGLAQMDLDINRLREAAREGRVYGFLTSGYSQPRLLEILNMPAVRTIRIVDAWTIG